MVRGRASVSSNISNNKPTDVHSSKGEEHFKDDFLRGDTFDGEIESQTESNDSQQKVDLLLSADDLNVLSIKLGMERTYFAAFNSTWIMAIAGIGLMSVGTNEASTGCGAFILSASIVFCLAAFVMHHRRAHVFLKQDTGRTETILWMGMITFVSLAALILELVFGIMYPYLDREKAVSIKGQAQV